MSNFKMDNDSIDAFDPMTFDPVPARGDLKDIVENRPYSCEAKLDGVRQIFTLKKDGDILMTGRRNSVKTGQKLNKIEWVPHIASMLRFICLTGWVLDGELYIKRGTSNNVVSVLGSSLDRALELQSGFGCELSFRLFDVLFYHGRDVRNEPLYRRYDYMDELMGYVARYNEIKPVAFKRVPIFHDSYKNRAFPGGVILPESVITECYDAAVSKGFEGLIVKGLDCTYTQKAWAKVKQHKTFDYVVCGVDDSSSETYSGWGVAALILGLYDSGGNLIPLTRCSGLTDYWRAEFYNFESKYIGKTVEVEAQQQYPTGALRHPRFKGVRNDANSSEQTLEKYNLHESEIVKLEV